MLSYSDFKTGLGILGLKKVPVIVHASLKAFGRIQGDGDTWLNAVLMALIDTTGGLMMPTFTYKTMVTPGVGPPNNGITYGKKADLNLMAECFHYEMPADPLMGKLPEALRKNPYAMRTAHPILSFAGINVDEALAAQTLYNPLEPVGVLANQDGWVLLMGVDHTVNTSIHYAEKLAGRHQFVRWAYVKKQIVECYGFPGCSDGFTELEEELGPHTNRVEIGPSFVDAIPIKALIRVVRARLKANPLDLLCQREDCERCQDVRNTLIK
ncbi:MAG: AAC(3) family N-acetyltransferase [Anaerolineales bacterium]